MEDRYGMADLRQYINGKPFFPAISQPPDLLSSHRGLAATHPYDMLMFRSDSAIITPPGNNIAAGNISGGLSGFDMDPPGGLSGGGNGGDCSTARWPRQETLTLLEIRSRLDAKFKEANQKGPLWDEVSRILSEEYGYQRSGKKCREKFENLYKYYKKTRDGKSGRQDGKHYRFFRQLEALYGEPSNSSSASETHFNGGSLRYTFQNTNISSSLNQELYPGSKMSETSFPNSSDYDTTSSDCSVGGDTGDPRSRKRRGKRSLKAKIRESISDQMEKLMEKQEAWMQKMMTTIEEKERERMAREEQWRKQDAARIEREQKLWASERAWIEARDIALMDAFQKLTGKELRVSAPEEMGATGIRVDERESVWPESEITRLIQLRTAMDSRFGKDAAEEVLWGEIAAKMGCYGHERSGPMCREKWDSLSNYLLKCGRKRKDQDGNARFHEANSDQGFDGIDHLNDQGRSPPRNSHGGDPINESCFRYFIGDSYGRL